MSTRVAGALIGIVFGVVLSWSGMTSPEVIREGLLFQDPYLFLFFAGAMSTAFVGLRILRRRAPRALLTGEPVQWEPSSPSAATSPAACCSASAGASRAPARARSRRSSARASPGASRRRSGSSSGSCCSAACSGARCATEARRPRR